MPEITIRPSLKLIKLSYWTWLLLAVGLLILSRTAGARFEWVIWTLTVPAVGLLWTAARHIRRSLTRLTISADRLRFESGLLSKQTRAMELAKLQDVRVEQSLGQRMLGVGNLSIETAGGGGRLIMPGIDQPQQVADRILDAARALSKGGAA